MLLYEFLKWLTFCSYLKKLGRLTLRSSGRNEGNKDSYYPDKEKVFIFVLNFIKAYISTWTKLNICGFYNINKYNWDKAYFFLKGQSSQWFKFKGHRVNITSATLPLTGQEQPRTTHLWTSTALLQWNFLLKNKQRAGFGELPTPVVKDRGSGAADGVILSASF